MLIVEIERIITRRVNRVAVSSGFGCGDDNPIGLRLRFTPSGEGVKASFIPSAEHQGFQEVVHGGIISTVLDEAMA